MMTDTERYLFHVHTVRCGHAEAVDDEAYIEKAVELGAERIVFTDHAPFPGNPFGNRMRYGQLDEYISSLQRLQKKYAADIAVDIGLEIEYLPSFRKYYEELRQIKELDLLLLGQHIYECRSEVYNFSIPDQQKRKAEEYSGIANAICEGIRTGYFDAVAHPDRAFRYCGEWQDEYTELSQKIIIAAEKESLPLEINLAGKEAGYYREEFWKLVPEHHPVIYGVDAHRVAEMERIKECMKEDEVIDRGHSKLL